MKAEAWQEIEYLYNAALAQDPSCRSAFLKQACSGDEGLQREVESLLDQCEEDDRFLEIPALELALQELDLRLSQLPTQTCGPVPDTGGIEPPFVPGELLAGRFRLLREVGYGGMGVVYEAFDEKLQKRIAIKCARPGFQQRLSPEARTATEISHPNVCKLYEIHSAQTEFGEVDFLTMEYLEGETLAECIGRRGPLPTREACELMRQVCAGVEEAHRNRVIHSDLKTSNIILTEHTGSGLRAVITDFGMARQVIGPSASQLLASVSGGTPAYMAPELRRGDKASRASDIYALGVILYETLTGCLPVTGDGAQRHGSSLLLPAGLPPGAGRTLNRIVSRCLAADPAMRPATAAEVATALASLNQTSLVARTSGLAAAILFLGPLVLYEPSGGPLRLAVLPAEAAADQQALADQTLHHATGLLSAMRYTGRSFAVIPPDIWAGSRLGTPERACRDLGATHVLRSSLQREGPMLIARAAVMDACSQQTLNEFALEYRPDQAVLIPPAFEGAVTRSLHLRTRKSVGLMNTAAAPDYLAGLAHLEHDSETNEALTSLERAASIDDRAPAVSAALAEAWFLKYKLTGDVRYQSLAIKAAKRGESINPDSAAVCRITGMLRLDSGQYARAADDFQRSIQLEPGNPDGYRRLARAWQKMDRSREAIETLRKAIEVQPLYFKTYQQLGGFYYDAGAYDKAADQLRKVVDLTHGAPDARVSLASVYIKAGQYQQAEQELRAALSVRESMSALTNLGAALEYQGRDSEAVTYYRRAVAIVPDAWLAWANLGDAFRRMHTLPDSAQAYRKALEITRSELQRNPQDAYIRAYVGYLLARSGNAEQAQSEIDQSLRFPPADAQLLRVAAKTYEALGRREATLAALKDAPRALIADLSRYPDMSDLRADPRFKQLMRGEERNRGQ